MITRVWVGPELEGFDQGINTLFIEGEYLNSTDVIDYLQQTNCKRLYLGAGGKGIIELLNIPRLRKYCEENEIEVVAEIPIDLFNICDINIFKYCHIILTAKGEKSKYINQFKTDDRKQVDVFNLKVSAKTDLSTLNNGLFDLDTLIYERNEE